MSGLVAATATQWIVVLLLIGVLCVLSYVLVQVHDQKVPAAILAIMVAAAAFFALSALLAISGSTQDWEDFKKFVEDIFPFLDLGGDGDNGGTTTTG